jgi:hypothetical protein
MTITAMSLQIMSHEASDPGAVALVPILLRGNRR